MFDLVRAKISKNNILRVGINMSNFLLVNKDSTFSNPKGLSPDIGALLAKELDLQCQFISFKNPGELSDATDQNKWDVGNFAYEKKRAEIIDFSNPYINIDANFIVRNDNKISKNEEVDTKNLKIAVVNRSAYDLWLSDNFKNAKIVRAKTIIESHKLFNEGKADVLAGLKPKLVEELEANKNLRKIIEELRLKCGLLMNLGSVKEKTVPKITIVSKAQRGGTISTRTFIPHTCHKAIGVLGAVSVATACAMKGSTAYNLALQMDGNERHLSIEHPTGEMTVVATIDENGTVSEAAILRTARKLMDGEVFI